MHRLRSWAIAPLVLLASSVHAFGDAGHHAVGQIADRLLAGTTAGQAAAARLGGTLRTAAIWADCVRAVDKNGHYRRAEQESPACKAAFENPQSIGAMEAFVGRNRLHTRYHYVNLPFQSPAYDGSPSYANNAGHDLVDAINAAIAVLKSRQPRPPFRIHGDREALRLLAHFIGDLHQPLHVANVYLEPSTGAVLDPVSDALTLANGTHGGNSLLMPDGRNLHGWWDALPSTWTGVTDQVLDEARSLPVSDGPLETWARQWATESLLQGRPAFDGLAYTPSKHGDAVRYRLTMPANYDQVRESTTPRQVVKAGARLAHVLQRIYGQTP